MLSLRKRENVWYVIGNVNGKRIRMSTKTNDQSEAQRFRIRLENKMVNGSEKNDSGCRLKDAIKSYLSRREFVSRTTQNYLEKFKERWGDVPIKKIDQCFIANYIDERYAEVQGATIRREVNAFMPVLRHAKKRGMINIVPDVDRPSDGEPRTRFLDKDEVDALLGSHDGPDGEKSIADVNGKGVTPRLTLTAFLKMTGARIGEATQLTWNDVELDAKAPYVTLTTRKTRGAKKSERRVPLSNVLVDVLNHMHTSATCDDDRCWDCWLDARGAGKAVTALAHEAGIKNFQPHDLRRTFATTLLREGVRERVVADLLGHSSLAMVMRYMIPPDETKVEAIRSLEVAYAS